MRWQEIGLDVRYGSVEEAAPEFLLMQMAQWFEPHRLNCFACFAGVGEPCDEFVANVQLVETALAAVYARKDAAAQLTVRGAAARGRARGCLPDDGAHLEEGWR